MSIKQSRNQLFNGALFLLLSLNYTFADGNVGCLYDDELCDPRTEWCYDDFAFGRCVFKVGFGRNDLFRYEFQYHDLEKLKEELEQLKTVGFSWKHAYTQCIMQTQLYAIKFGVPYNGDVCEQILKTEITDPIRELQYEHMRLPQGSARNSKVPSPVNEGIVKYEPDDESAEQEQESQATDYENELLNRLRVQNNPKSGVYKKSLKSTLLRHRGTPLYLPKHNRKPTDYETEEEEEDENEFEENMENYSPVVERDPSDLLSLRRALAMLDGDKGAKAYAEGGPMDISDKKDDYENSVYDKILNQYGADIFGFHRSERLDVKKPGPYYKVNNYAFGNMNSVPENNDKNTEDDDQKSEKKVHRNVNIGKPLPFKEQKSEYEYVPNYGHLSYVIIETNNNLTGTIAHSFIGTLRNMYNLPPGVFKEPTIFGNILVLTVARNIVDYSAADIKRRIEEYYNSMNQIAGIEIKKIYVSFSDELIKDMADSDQYNPETNYAYIQLKDKPNNRIKTWTYADDIIESIGEILNLPKGVFSNIKTAEPAGILFKISPQTRNITAKDVAEKINSKKDEINKRLKIDIQSAGIYNKDSLPTAVRVEPDNDMFKLTYVVCGVIAAVLVSIVALYFVKKQSKANEKIYGITRDKEILKDHQDSCRSRMSGKSNIESPVPGQRITSLSRESDNSPSSRSSTSSWSEEPMTNMDITTGHMVLAYMEDHLTNKARLDTEWAALCAYDADPCSLAIAQQQENIRKNRYVNALPYDHARVILNALSNINGSDYINASTITDHDPRNAAYIATQGPLENTVCDFWQMIWEQGCVVIVMLTRLVENDTSMCHRYWPLERAELYNIYEVHLVSEHIWCDDFLVRSFYLKNLKTTETRTVTQFHFLTWPEGGIPSATKPLLEFRRKVNKSFRGRSCPIMVHCSDGVGRTGSYLLLDMVLNRISKGAKEIDIAATLEHIRDQRAGAVCTKQQFQFVLSAVAEEVQAVLKALPQQQQQQQQQASQDPNAENVIPLVQVSNDPPESVATTSGVDTTNTNSTTINSSTDQSRKSSK